MAGELSRQTSFGRYLIQSILGRGGMSIVYRAYDPLFARLVAIKVLPNTLLTDPAFLVRFQREAKTIAALEHPAIVPVYDYGEEQGQPYMVMRYMPGGSLDDRLDRGPLSLPEVTHLFSHLAPALDKAHSLGIVHRDLKPGNILFDQEGESYLSDFGIVKLTEATTTLTAGLIIGTSNYMSPEQGLGKKDIDSRSDIYSLGAILFHILTGKLPYEAETSIGQIMMHITQPVPNIISTRPDLPKQVQTLITCCMAKNREERYSTVTELAAALSQLLTTTTATQEMEKPLISEGVGLHQSSLDYKPDLDQTHIKPSKSTPLFQIPSSQMPVLAGALVPSPVMAIMPDNANQVVELARLGKGFFRQSAWSPDERILAVASSIGIYIYDSQTLAEIKYIDTNSYVNTVAFSPDGQILASGGETSISLWRISDYTLLRTLQGYIHNVTSVAFSPDGQILASGSEPAIIILWWVSDGRPICFIHKQTVNNLAFSPDGKLLASVCNSENTASRYIYNIIRLWRVSDGTLLHTLEGHASSVYRVSFSPDGHTLVSCSGDKTILWRVTDGVLLHTQEGSTPGVISPDGQIMVLAYEDSIHLHRTSDSSLLRTRKEHIFPVDNITFSPDGQIMASRTGETIRLWRFSDNTPLLILEVDYYVTSVAFSADGKILASGSNDYTTRMWRISDGSLLYTLKEHRNDVDCVAFSPDNQFLASGSDDRIIQLWRVSDGALINTLKGHRGGVTCVLFSPDGQILVSGSFESIIRLWHVPDGSPIHTLQGPGYNTHCLAISPDGQILAASGDEGETIRLWRMSDGTILHEFAGGGGVPVAFSPDGQILAAGKDYRNIGLWRVSDGALLRILKGHTSNVTSVVFLLNGKLLVSTSQDDTIRLWGIK